MHRYVIAICAAAMLLGGASTAAARGQTATAPGAQVVLAPLGTLGSEAKSTKENRRIQQVIAAGLRAVPGVALVGARALRLGIKRAKKPELRVCDGKVGCLTQLGKLLGARYVVYGEIGGLGEVQVVYLKTVDVNAGRELRSTTLELGAKPNPELARAAAFRLLAPDRYRGRLVISVDVKGASIYVDGNHVAKSPTQSLPLSVGTHAIRVTHPEYRDFVRFVDIGFDRDARVGVKLSRYPIVESNIKERPGSGATHAGTRVVYRGNEQTPWYRRWYTVAGAGAAIFVGSALIVGIIADGIAHDREKTVGE